ncbi:MAG TPA: hypothetical protein PKV75_06430 [Desulfobacterales bacterium]|nr:hypothetical protein [Desulfobacterales bacterium]
MQVQELIQPYVGDHCIICGAPPEVIGIFKPDTPSLYGAPPGKTRFIRYCLCEKCRTSKGVAEQVEKIIHAELLEVPHGDA